MGSSRSVRRSATALAVLVLAIAGAAIPAAAKPVGGGSVSGRVVAAGGAPLAGICVGLDNGGGAAPFAADTGFSIVQNRFATGAALAAPTSNGTLTLGRWGAANAIAIVPEPATAMLGLLGLAGLSLRRRVSGR